MKHIFSKKFLSSVIGIVALLVILVIINLVAGKIYFRTDITEDRIYSLSDGTKKMLRDLPEDVTMKLFFSSSMVDVPPIIKQYAGRVKDLLKEYENNSGGAVTVEFYDPKLDSDEEEWAQKYGVAGNPINPFVYDELLYFGLVAEALDHTATIPVLDPKRERYLEYDVSQLIFQVLNPEKKTIGVLSSLPVTGTPGPAFMMSPQAARDRKAPWVLVQELKQMYNVINISTNVSVIETDIDVLLVIHPKNFSDSLQFAIDQYVMNGGKAVFFVDPFCTIDQTATGMGFPMPGSSDLNTLFEAWGVSVPKDKVVADLDNPTTIAVGQNRAEKNPVWITASGPMFNDDEISCADLGMMIFPVIGQVEPGTNAAVSIIPLVSSSTNAMAIQNYIAQSNAGNIKRQFVPAGKSFSFAVKLNGILKTAFPDGVPGASNDVDVVSATASLNTVIIVADVDMLADQFNIRQMNFLGMKTFQRINNNFDFVINTIDQLTGDENLIAVRSRANTERPFTVVQELERNAQDKYLAKEKELAAEYDQVRRRLAELQAQKDESKKLIVSDEQRREIEQWQNQRIEVARELKEVRKNLTRDKENLGFRLKVYNMALMPAIVCLFGIGLALYRHYKVKQS